MDVISMATIGAVTLVMIGFIATIAAGIILGTVLAVMSLIHHLRGVAPVADEGLAPQGGQPVLP